MKGELKPCPFCGNKKVELRQDDSYAFVWCTCGAFVRARGIPEYYERTQGELYRKIPSVDKWDAVREAWNRRADT